MATDWSGRTAALKYYEHELAVAKRSNFADKDFIEQAVNALRRSQDHTAIQTKLNDATKLLREIKGVFAGDAAPHWVNQIETTMMRGLWLDQIDAMLGQQAEREKEKRQC